MEICQRHRLPGQGDLSERSVRANHSRMRIGRCGKVEWIWDELERRLHVLRDKKGAHVETYRFGQRRS